MWLNTACVHRNTALRLTAMLRSHSSSVISGMGEGARHPGVVDQDIDRAEAVDGLRHHRLHRRLVGDVGGDGQRLAAERPDLPGHRLYLGRGPRRQRDVGSLARQCERGRPADAAPGPVTMAV